MFFFEYFDYSQTKNKKTQTHILFHCPLSSVHYVVLNPVCCRLEFTTQSRVYISSYISVYLFLQTFLKLPHMPHVKALKLFRTNLSQL